MENGAVFAGPDFSGHIVLVTIVKPVSSQLGKFQVGALFVEFAVAHAAVILTLRDVLMAGVVIAGSAQVEVIGINFDLFHHSYLLNRDVH